MSDKRNKDRLHFYMFRNVFATFCVTLIAFSISLSGYYKADMSETLQRIFVYDIYTTIYFVVLWIFNYVFFEISKIISDSFKEKITYISVVVLILLCIILLYAPIFDLFKYNFIFLLVLIILRMIKQIYKLKIEAIKKFLQKS